ncbi:FAD-binding oxidoreductase [Nocardia seriolae]|uniref:Decaprenylphospho-beta-D-ribofuranose 2-dehydrogenase n=1 Tax=Nocardia seriolae TaxID=37332 RepID=A0A0B8NK64_9NOCA|nr:FAD-binding oxidoreductase [Nocardia seriolae]GEM26157.1 decaprenylphosphoryl-beta-D-ribose oxidase [Nocardia seriolae NBRC 15557]APA97884.1 Decaprenylphospho-beta-D-ribofuranose 2-dehydrogenase [Nocardia seriolae]MTJ64368.1 FAD-binding protein [Nocardia seriolae]MTJ73609.1 FAD-binding protein [Nocardia seriolae]MTJ87637.1 FAD-binding protein [Nocardia seriolae]
MIDQRRLFGWARTAASVAQVLSTPDLETVAREVGRAGARGVIARGLGRSYGDPAQNGGGLVVDMTAFDRIHTVDPDSGIVDADAGVSLDALMKTVLPQGLWVPVLPGTRQVTVGGAIASDIHGKNHHSHGSFGNHVVSLDLLTADGQVRTLTPDGPQSQLFWATVGGMGLTGIIVRARVRMKHTETAYFIVDNDRTGNLDETMELLTGGSDDGYEYSMSVPDTISTDSRLGRAGFSRGSLATLDQLPPKLRRDPLRFDAPQLFTVPDIFPNGMVNNLTIRVAAEAAYRVYPERARGRIQNLTQFYHPLDLPGEWNRAYGRRGFLQYQFSMPFGAERQLAAAVRVIAFSGHRSFLNVFKRMGEGNPGPLSWPHPGYMLSLDFPLTPGLGEFCARLDQRVLDAGGRLYFAKDSRTTPDMIRAMYPRLEEWRRIRDAVDPERVFTSDLARRLHLIDDDGPVAQAG